MTKKVLLFCDSCLEDIPDARPGECFTSYITLMTSGSATLGPMRNGVKHFHDSRCMTAFLASVLPEGTDR